MIRKAVLGAAVVAFALPLAAQEIEMVATDEEIAGVLATLALINCTLGEGVVEKENEDLFEIDDAQCEIGQYDIKLDADFNIISMTRD